MVCDTHYYQVLFYRPDGELLKERTIGGKNGRGPGEFGFITDVAQDSKGNFYIGEYGDFDRIQKFDPDGEYLSEFGSHGTEPEEFLRPQCLTIDREDYLWVTDISNHRVQVFDVSGPDPKLVRVWGSQGAGPGEFSYPNSIWIDDERNQVLVCDMGNHRVQVFNKSGDFLGAWGRPGRLKGEMYQPWALVRDSQGSVHVIDTYNHRVQRFEIEINQLSN
jgi:sugar lactone lactonase YvrE